MASTPYGYKIVMGKAVIDPEAKARFDDFIDHYLGGLSVKEANKIAGIPLSASSLNKLLRNETYLGTDYYPPLITAEVFYAVQEEREKRTHEGTSAPVQPVPVKSRFILASLERVEHGADVEERHGADVEETRGTAAETVAHLYSAILPSETGRTMAAGAEAAAIRSWLEDLISSSPAHGGKKDERSASCQ